MGENTSEELKSTFTYISGDLDKNTVLKTSAKNNIDSIFTGFKSVRKLYDKFSKDLEMFTFFTRKEQNP